MRVLVPSAGAGVPADTNATANTLAYRDANGGLTNAQETCSAFTCTGPVIVKWNAVTGNYSISTVPGGDCVVYVDCTTGNKTVTMAAPAALGAGQLLLIIKKDSSANTLTVLQNATETLNGNSSAVLTTQYAALEVFNDGTNWVYNRWDGAHLVVQGSAPTAAAGANAGTSPPAPVVAAASNDTRGSLTFGTGTTPAAGAQVAVTFNVAYAAAPFVTLTPINSATAALGVPYLSAVGTGGFTINTPNAPAGSQANTTYGYHWHVVG